MTTFNRVTQFECVKYDGTNIHAVGDALGAHSFIDEDGKAYLSSDGYGWGTYYQPVSVNMCGPIADDTWVCVDFSLAVGFTYPGSVVLAEDDGTGKPVGFEV